MSVPKAKDEASGLVVKDLRLRPYSEALVENLKRAGVVATNAGFPVKYKHNVLKLLAHIAKKHAPFTVR